MPDGKTVETIEHEDGRRSVTVHVNALNIKETDLESQEAKKTIEERVLPKLAAQKVQVVVVHKPTNQHAASKVALPDVRKFAEAAVQSFRQMDWPHPKPRTKDKDFVIVEVHEEGGVSVSAL